MRALYLLIALMLIIKICEASDEKRVLNNLILEDVRSACIEGQRLVKEYPDSERCWEVYIQALAKKGDTHQTLQAWNQFIGRFPERVNDRFLLESMAWGVIENNSTSPSPIIRSYALIGAFFGEDARGVKIICKGFKDPNIAIRVLALKISGFLRDYCLQQEVLRLLKEDGNLQVRLEAMEAVGKMKIREAEPYLLNILQSSHARAEEKFAAIQALVSIYEQLSMKQVRVLVHNSRSALRELACRVVLRAGIVEAIPEVTLLLNDASPNVRCAALETIGGLRRNYPESLIVRIRELSCDSNPRVAITASWALMFTNSEEGYLSLCRYMEGDHRDYRLLAGSALVSTGKYGRPYLERAFNDAQDSFLKMNLAFGMIVNGCRVEQSCDLIAERFVDDRCQWMWKQQGIFRILAPSDVKHVPWISNHPEMVNQMTRLEVLNILAIKKASHALEAAKSFLSRRQWGISGMASSLILQEGDESAIALVHLLLQDPSAKVRVQAALILAMWGGDAASVQELQDSYDKSDRELKERILEGLGNVGSKYSLSFLTQRLGDPQPTLKVIAAAALLQCLYH